MHFFTLKLGSPTLDTFFSVLIIKKIIQGIIIISYRYIYIQYVQENPESGFSWDTLYKVFEHGIIFTSWAKKCAKYFCSSIPK